MPTGYTYKIKDGISFKDYALMCARAFGACISMRDESMDVEIPNEFKENDFYYKKIGELHQKYEEFGQYTDLELQSIIDAEYEKKILENKKHIEENKKLKLKYDRMLWKIERWAPPTQKHMDLKKFMKDQIELSYFDCDNSYYENVKIIKLNPNQYRYKEMEKIQNDVDYYMKEWIKETERVQDRNKWIKDLRESLE
jgi:hypothetical protein